MSSELNTESVGQEPVHTQKELSTVIEQLKGLWPGDEKSFHEFMKKVIEHAGVIRDLKDWDNQLEALRVDETEQ